MDRGEREIGPGPGETFFFLQPLSARSAKTLGEHSSMEMPPRQELQSLEARAVHLGVMQGTMLPKNIQKKGEKCWGKHKGMVLRRGGRELKERKMGGRGEEVQRCVTQQAKMHAFQPNE